MPRPPAPAVLWFYTHVYSECFKIKDKYDKGIRISLVNMVYKRKAEESWSQIANTPVPLQTHT